MNSFSSVDTSSCCLCGSNKSLSGEHKIKASVLREEFGRERLVIGRQGEGYRFAQSTGSKAFHFAAPLCGECNSARTQPADLAFVEFHATVRQLTGDGKDPMEAFGCSRFSEGGVLRLDVFRYFAKLLCCHLAELGAPRQEEISDFAIGWSDENYILLGMDMDQNWARAQGEFSGLPYAAHGGLIVFGDREKFFPAAFFSTLTIGPVRYQYNARLTEEGQLRMQIETPDFFDWCRDRVREAASQPQSDVSGIVLGL